MDKISKGLSHKKYANYATHLLVMGDVIALVIAMLLSLKLRFDNFSFAKIFSYYLIDHKTSLLLSIPIYITIYAIFRLYRCAWRFASIETVRDVVSANSLAFAILMLSQRIIEGKILPLSVLFNFWILSIVSVGSVRIILRLLSLSQSYGGKAVKLIKTNLTPTKAIILGGGSNGARLVTALREDPSRNYDILGFLDDSPEKKGLYIKDIKVLGPLSKLPKMLDDGIIDEVLIALPNPSGDEIREHVMLCKSRKIPVKIIPEIEDILNGNHKTIDIEEISVEDLLRRPPVRINLDQIGNFLTGKRVLITGAGGSIGSEICRQIAALELSEMILLGHGENSIHKIQQELKSSYPNLSSKIFSVIASVADENRIDYIFEKHKPEVVFHAAAHKHVPIMEENILEAVQNNVLGTSIVAEACGRHNTEKMVLISTDKAVYPTSVMGSTKYLCECICRSLVNMYPETSFITVRFGNVLGSRGSVVPIFQEQIKKGGPVTITDPEMTRFFMSIPEAVQLVLQAGAIGSSGELYILDMGEPIKILDLARDMIKLCGYEPHKDIDIVFTGLRPGEKVHEELVSKDEKIEPAESEGMSVIRRNGCMSSSQIIDILTKIKTILDHRDENRMAEFLSETIGSYSKCVIEERKSTRVN
ncbi:MAG: nucleoside-diphosphate sugar epimerase/dehydratase [Armatimonadota bacterium]